MTTNTNRFRKAMAGLALVGATALGVGAVGVAGADAATKAPRPTTTTTCAAQLRALRLQQAELDGKIDVLQRERNVALAHHRDELAKKLEGSILDLQARRAVVHAKIVVLEQRCG